MLETAFILAAGLGTRMRPLTEHTAKPLLYYRGERLIHRHLHRLALAGFQQVVINCSWHGQQLRQLVGDGSDFGLSIRYSCEGDTPLETASGINHASSLLGDKPFLLLNGDIWTDLDLQSLRQVTHCPSIVLVNNPPHNPHGDFAMTSQQTAYNQGQKKLTYAGIGVYQRSFLESAKPNGAKLADRLRESANRNELKAIHHSGEWYDAGTPAAIQNQ